MVENPYEPSHLPARPKVRYIVGPSSNYALLAFPIAWLALPTLWLINVIRFGTYIFWAEFWAVFFLSALYGTLAGAVLWAFLVVILRAIRHWNERRQQWPE
jgi:hypothetical protein